MREKAKLEIQEQLRKYLKQYRMAHDLSAEQAAEKLGVEIATYRTLEGKKPANRVMSSLEYLGNIAKLSRMSLTSFIKYLERNDRTKSGSNELKRELYGWEQEVLDYFDQIGIPIRKKFLEHLRKQQDEYFQEQIYQFIQIVMLPKEKKQVIDQLLKVLREK